jgi:hypothetical protein
MGSTRLRDLLNVIELVGRGKSDEWLKHETERWLRLGADGQRPAIDVERARSERELGGKS